MNSLLKQTIIEDCMLYMVSDDSPIEERLIHQFKSNKKLNVMFLKNINRSGPGVARNKGINNSYNKFLCFLDSDDFLFDPNSLE
jgi:glycosyltransferase involved in cell wall biosynthesis